MRLFAAIAAALVCASCAKQTGTQTKGTPLVFVFQPLGGDAAPFDALLDDFRKSHPDIALTTQLLPNNSDVAHQYFVTSLEGGTQQFDVLVTDVVWTPEFARAGWLADVSEAFPQTELKRDFLPGPVEAVTFEGRTYAVPWYVDVGLLYYRTDLVPRAPTTYGELESFALAAKQKDPSLRGYMWQGRQYEGLVCNAYEVIWGFGGQSLNGGRLALDSPQATAALAQLRRYVETGVSPPSVTSAAEEESRLPFHNGKAVFMRNWPYAWREATAKGSPIEGKVGFAPLPTVDGTAGPGTLGGWQLAVNAHSSRERKAAAVALVRQLTSEKGQLVMAAAYGRNPSRTALYSSDALKQTSPFMVALLPHFERARPRPVTPYYGMISDVLQSEFSAAVSGVRTPAVALERAQKRADHLMGVSR